MLKAYLSYLNLEYVSFLAILFFPLEDMFSFASEFLFFFVKVMIEKLIKGFMSNCFRDFFDMV